MKELDKFSIDIIGLSYAKHDYQFDIGNSFFKCFEDSYTSNGEGMIDVVLDKHETFINASININVKVVLVCDRSLDEYDHQISIIKEVIFKHGAEEEEVDDHVIIISFDRQQLNLAQYIYEFIGLEIPMKKLHPRFSQDDNEDELVYTSAIEEETEKEETDPRWSALEKLNKKKN